MLREFDKEIVFGRTLVEKLIRHLMRTYLDAGFVCTSRAWIRNKLEMVKYIRLLIEKGAKVPEDYHSVTGIFRNLRGIFPKEVAITIRP